MFNPNNPIFNQMFGGFNNFQNNFNQFAQQLGQGMDPNSMERFAQNKVQEMLNTGQMSPQQFEQIRQVVNQMTGRNM